MKKILCFFIITLLLPAFVFAFEIKDTNIPDKIKVDKYQLTLNGAGVRKKFFMSIYIGALYLPEKNNNPNEIISMDAPKSILMHFLYSKVSKEKIIDAFKDDFENNAKDLLPNIKKELNEFYSYFDKDIVRKDEIHITYLPDKGTCIKINNNLKGCIKNKDFMTAIFSVWLGEDPPSEGLKDAMLGKE